MNPQTTFWQNLRDLPGSITLSGVAAGFIAVLVGYTGPLLILLQAAQNAHLTQAQTSSWVWAVAVGNGVMTILLSLWYRQPITAPWSTAGAALLVTSLMNYPFPQAVGAYIVAGLAIAALGFSGLFGRVMALIPQPIVLAMLAGILLKFGIGIFTNLPKSPFMIITMLVVFFLLVRFKFRAPTLITLVVGVLIALIAGELHFESVTFGLTIPVFTAPEFSLNAILALSLPLVALALTSQYATGQAVLRSFDYVPPINGILIATGLASTVLAFFGGHGLSLGALTAAMVMTPEVQPDITRRYSAGIAFGGWYILFGMFGATIISLFAGFPAPLVAAIAGLALTGAIGSSLSGAMAQPEMREAALVTFLCTAGDFSLLGIGAPFWGLVAGLAVYLVLRR